MNNNLSVVKDSFKELPNNIEAEQAVLGSMLSDKNSVNKAFEKKTILRKFLQKIPCSNLCRNGDS